MNGLQIKRLVINLTKCSYSPKRRKLCGSRSRLCAPRNNFTRFKPQRWLHEWKRIPPLIMRGGSRRFWASLGPWGVATRVWHAGLAGCAKEVKARQEMLRDRRLWLCLWAGRRARARKQKHIWVELETFWEIKVEKVRCWCNGRGWWGRTRKRKKGKTMDLGGEAQMQWEKMMWEN